ncbi:PilZ domain-containing protein [Sphingomonas solaris]|uniref:PilZ domain-containing protein n=1 Tax=Alterirhizorhabdus solaris TaxID=2529389 RepID=A0A558QV85_9SPHN|nr:PilZ domain-containing protein [Sphingomonas solaris]TVV71056.1 PilZ domain-containing protein [Sphingomonas solaris]
MDRHDPDDRAGNDEAAARSRRAAPRDSLLLHATLQRVGDEAPLTIRVRNLSPGGMMAEVGTPFEPGDRIAIDLRGVGPLEGTVAWREIGRVGISFDREIDPHAARKAVTPPRPATTAAPAPPRPRRPRLFGE